MDSGTVWETSFTFDKASIRSYRCKNNMTIVTAKAPTRRRIVRLPSFGPTLPQLFGRLSPLQR